MSFIPCPVCGRRGEVKPRNKSENSIGLRRLWPARQAFCSYCGILFHPSLSRSWLEKAAYWMGLAPARSLSVGSKPQIPQPLQVADESLRPAFLPEKKQRAEEDGLEPPEAKPAEAVKPVETNHQLRFSINHPNLKIDFQLKLGRSKSPAMAEAAPLARPSPQTETTTPDRRKITLLAQRNLGQKRFRSDFPRLLGSRRLRK